MENLDFTMKYELLCLIEYKSDDQLHMKPPCVLHVWNLYDAICLCVYMSTHPYS